MIAGRFSTRSALYLYTLSINIPESGGSLHTYLVISERTRLFGFAHCRTSTSRKNPVSLSGLQPVSHNASGWNVLWTPHSSLSGGVFGGGHHPSVLISIRLLSSQAAKDVERVDVPLRYVQSSDELLSSGRDFVDRVRFSGSASEIRSRRLFVRGRSRRSGRRAETGYVGHSFLSKLDAAIRPVEEWRCRK